MVNEMVFNFGTIPNNIIKMQTANLNLNTLAKC